MEPIPEQIKSTVMNQILKVTKKKTKSKKQNLKKKKT